CARFNGNYKRVFDFW
nr:immunoglobulin heavy chain junction region [Macaca mulatta]MOV36366.1 immunoglobulin heavy chain junction region [Macaca mulatta]MOV36415.1 immunoglobulin heavy chain junction region [Macaca mulatta]MOV36430.1 immunoglobulin heavy chain junction region [Macaca mulatta]MOV36585.1 immunoglobulin heavy chain junction region [Macaca mulatta]